MEVRGWSRDSGTVVIVLNKMEFDYLRGLLLELKDSHCPGDGTCNAKAFNVVTEICRERFEEVVYTNKILIPGEARNDKVSIVLDSHTYVDFQELLEKWTANLEYSKKKIPAIAVVSGICSRTWGSILDDYMKK